MTARFLRITVLSALLLACAQVAPAIAAPTFRPRVGKAMGLVPVVGSQDVAVGTPFPEVYHGGSVMSDVTVHTIFWAPSGYSFGGSPSAGVLGYEPLIQQFFTDVAHDSGSTTNIFSMLNQYRDSAGQGGYDISYNAATDTVNDTDPYPSSSEQCASPSGVATCLTDLDVSREINKVIGQTDPSGRDLHNLWEVFLPVNVDECTGEDECGTNAFAGYHSLANQGNGQFIYAVIINTLIEEQPLAGADPEGNPIAEASIDTAGHETMEAITNPEGVGWMDPNGFEIADKCEDGPQTGTPLGYAPDGSPYDQLINGHEYDIQMIWSDAVEGCEQSSTVTTNGLPLPSVSLRQFSPNVSGSAGESVGGLQVGIVLVRGSDFVAAATATTRANGDWGPVTLRAGGRHSAVHALGDDRDVLLISYRGRRRPSPEVIETGSGGDPFTEAGWTGWLDLDSGFAVGGNSVTIGPCGQTGVLNVAVNGVPTGPPVAQCSTELDQSTVRTPHLSGASVVTMSSEDNRAVSILDPTGALVKLTVPLGEPDSVGVIPNNNVDFLSTGMPSCTANLRLQDVSCDGLVPGAHYTLTRTRGHAVRHARADINGTIEITDLPGRLPVAGGDVLTLRNGARRTLTVLHVAHLRVAIDGDQTVIASGSCQPGDYWGAPLTSLPSSSSVGVGGAAGTGTVCPTEGDAAGLPDNVIGQTDDLSGGQTVTSVPLLQGTAPSNDAIVSGPFTAIAQTGVTGANGAVFAASANVALTITSGTSHSRVFHAASVAGGADVPSLSAGVYTAKWVLSDRNGDTRTVLTKFVEQ